MIPTRQVVAGFGDIGSDNRRVITMEWVAEALSFWFVAILVVAVAASSAAEPAAPLVYRLSAGFLLVVGVWTSMTGARTGVIWFKLCPVIMSISAGLLIAASLV